ncbi:MAG: hypothetical protein KDI92_09325 [Xanthomonadales bacterium]|nr:hypothetical protein [Xanthomonadales bacterium]
MSIDVSSLPNALRIPWINNNETTVCDTHQLINGVPVGIWCTNNHVTEIHLFQMNLHGYIPVDIDNLNHLKILNLGSNFLSGEVPEQIGNLMSLEYLDLNLNILEGVIPDQIVNLKNLKHLDLSENKFFSSLPSQIGNLSQLSYLNIRGNSIFGGLPSSMANLLQLEILDMSNNYLGLGFVDSALNHQIPDWLYDLSQLKYVDLSNNALNGSLLPEISQLQALIELRLNDNFLADNIPLEISHLSELKELNLANNNFTGVLPESIGNLSNLITLGLSNNNLGGVIPASLNQLSKLKSLLMQNNQFSYQFPDLSDTNIPVNVGFFQIDGNCISAQQSPEVLVWLSERNVNLNNQNPVSNCMFYFPNNPDLIHRNGFAQNFNMKELLSTGSAQDINPGSYSIDIGGLLGNELILSGNTWKMIPYPYEVTPNTTLQFIFKASGAEAEVNGVALARDVTDSGPVYYNEKMLWQVFGTQNVGIPVGNYALEDGYVNYCIPVGQYMEGGINYLIFINDDDGTIQPNQSASYLIGLLGENQCTPTP